MRPLYMWIKFVFLPPVTLSCIHLIIRPAKITQERWGGNILFSSPVSPDMRQPEDCVVNSPSLKDEPELSKCSELTCSIQEMRRQRSTLSDFMRKQTSISRMGAILQDCRLGFLSKSLAWRWEVTARDVGVIESKTELRDNNQRNMQILVWSWFKPNWVSHMVQCWRISLPMQETQEMWVPSLGQEDPLE